jgi:two-component system, NtrC family, response regulator HydG
VVLFDCYTPGTSGADIVRALRQRNIDARIIFMSSGGPGDAAVDAVRLGVFDFVSKPLGEDDLRVRVKRALRDAHVAASGPGATAGRRPRKSDVIIGSGTWIKALYERLSMVAPTDVTVAISGESGTGKELVARTIHALSPRSDGPFIVVNCAAIPEHLLEDELFGHVKGAFTDAARDRDGLFAAAHTGTLFLDEIGEMPPGLQAKLLRVLQSHEFRRVGDDRDTRVDVRLITATNRDLEKAVQASLFRKDLYYRINVFSLVLPPLRERRDDIPLLAHHFLLVHRNKVGKRIEGFTPQAMSKLCSYDFPGNVRELENKVHHALVMAQGPYIQPSDISIGDISPTSMPHIDINRKFRDLKRDVIEAFERQYVEQILRAHGGNLAAAARNAGMDRKNLWSLARKYQFDIGSFRTKDE